jgi:protein-S-isoprenylcysteine O-methyltransferase
LLLLLLLLLLLCSSREMIAFVIGVLGGSLRVWSRYTLGRLFKYAVGIRPNHTLITSGPYQYLLHPSYTGAAALHFAYAWYTTSLGAGIIVVAGYFALLLKRMNNEEAVLVEEFGEAYRERQRKVARLIPFVY